MTVKKYILGIFFFFFLVSFSFGEPSYFGKSGNQITKKEFESTRIKGDKGLSTKGSGTVPNTQYSEQKKTSDTQNFNNEEYHFSFTFPASWHVQPPTTPNSKAKVASSSTPYAECAVGFKRVPMLDNMSQAELDLSLAQSPPSRDEYEAALKQGANNVSVIALNSAFFGSRAAHMIRARYSIMNASVNQFCSVRMAKGFSPGQSWTFTCGGHGKTPDEAEKAYEYWQSAINNIFFSFRFH
jgi:hypothetical protein